MQVLGVQESALADDVACVEVVTTTGVVVCLRHAGPGDGDEAVALFLGGALGGLSGPPGLYHRVARRTGGFRVHWRRPGALEECVLDALLVASLVPGAGRVVLVGHSFGGAVAVRTGVELGEACAGVATLATQVPGAERVAELAAPVLLVHGDADAILPWQASEAVHDRARPPKELVVVPGEGHLFEGVTDALAERVAAFVSGSLAA